MSKFPINLQNFKKISHDDKKAILRNSEGHEFHIAINAVSPKIRQAIDAVPMADGGNVVTEQSKKQPVKLANGGDPADAVQPEQHNGGQPIVINVGGQGQASGQQLPPVPEAAQPGAMAPAPSPQQNSFTMGQMGQDAANAVNPMAQGAGAQPDSNGQNIPEPAQASAPEAPSAPAAAQAATTEAPASVNSSAQPQAPASDPYGMGSYAEGVNRGYAEELKGTYDQAKAAEAAGTLKADAAHAEAARQQEVLQDVNTRIAHISHEQDQAVQDYRAGHIDPNRYLANMGTGRKIATAIGLILGGMGGAVTHQGNPALKFLEDQIDRDIDAQKQNLGKQHNLVSIYTQQFGNARDGALMASSVAKNIAAAQFEEAAAKSMAPQAQATAIMAAGKLRRDAAAANQQLGMRQTMMNLASNGDPSKVGSMLSYMRMTNPEMAKEYESRFIPGVGFAQVPVPEKVREEIKNHSQFDDAAKDLMKWTNSHNTNIPGTADYNTGVQKATQLQALIRENLLNTVYREGEQPLLDKMIKGNPANFLKNFNTIPQIKELMRSNTSRMNTLLKGYGVNRPSVPEGAPVR